MFQTRNLSDHDFAALQYNEYGIVYLYLYNDENTECEEHTTEYLMEALAMIDDGWKIQPLPNC